MLQPLALPETMPEGGVRRSVVTQDCGRYDPDAQGAGKGQEFFGKEPRKDVNPTRRRRALRSQGQVLSGDRTAVAGRDAAVPGY
jgi:hypothetical protein